MRLRSLSLLGLVAMVLAGFLPGIAAATTQDYDTNGYRSQQFGYYVLWTDDWSARDRDVTSVEGGADTLVLANNAGRVQIIGQETDISAVDLMTQTIEELTETASTVQMAANDSTPDLPSYIVNTDNTSYQIDIHDLEGVLVTVILSGRVNRFDQAQTLAQGVTLNGTPLLTGEPATALESDDLPTEDATEVVPTEEPDEEATGEAPRRTPTEPPTGNSQTAGDSGLEGSTFTSPGFGFSLMIPDGWQVQSEEITGGDESLLLFNGTSLITVRASNTLPLDLVACVNAVKAEAAGNPLYADLALDFTANGDLFQGSDDRGAYALYTYTGDDGAEWTYFVRCEPLVENESVLVIVQDVPSDNYIAERQARRLIQISIDRP